MKAITNNVKEQAIIGLIHDFIVWKRISDNMHRIVNAFDPVGNKEVYKPEYHFKGFQSVFKLLGIHKNEELCESLEDLFDNEYISDDSSEKVAERIYIEWLVEIRKGLTVAA